MRTTQLWLKQITKLGLILMMGVSMNADAGLFGLGGTSWKEEVLLHDGSKIIVERSVELGGRHELGQKPPIKEQSLTFTLPSTNQRVIWEDHYSEDVGSSNFNPMLLEIVNGTAYVLVSPAGCLSYNKWGRPNPPYVVFHYQGKEWKHISLQELPAVIKLPNLVISSPDDVAKKAKNGLLSAEMIMQANEGFRQPEYKTILREALAKERINEMCMEMVPYKGSWVMPNDPIARKFIDSQKR
ncbi:MAG: hypothetical protein Q8O38_06340 [Sulfurimicrobium sp.]|nr:hypothetical protein [Sulfurimicrobium sp.]